MSDMSPVIVPKSDQINADDLIAGPVVITITKVSVTPGTEQPVSINFEGSKKFFRPCKSMSRVMVFAWGPDSSKYVGRSLALYRDPKVKWGGLEVGGIRIGAMSHIDGPLTVVLTETKASRKPFLVKPLKAEQTRARPTQNDDGDFPGDRPTIHTTQSNGALPLAKRIELFRGRLAQAPSLIKADAIWKAAEQLRADADQADPEALAEMEAFYAEHRAELETATETQGA
jgi:hypothetical protein